MLSKSSPSLFRKRDIGILIIVLISIYLCYFDVPSLNYVIEPAWFIDQNELIPSLESINYKMIPPIITDLEGDGVNELILVTNDFKIKVNMIYIIIENKHFILLLKKYLFFSTLDIFC